MSETRDAPSIRQEHARTVPDAETIYESVRERYAEIALSSGCGCGPSCCDGASAAGTSLELGYGLDDVTAVPEGANMGLGCGNPQAIAALQARETMLDLGSGGGFDCFLAARQVGEAGAVIGVDMTPAMVAKARRNAELGSYENVDFRLGEIENLPVRDQSIDCVISNCVINLSPHKERVFQEAFRVLKSGGRLAISDIVATAAFPDDLRQDMNLLTGCMAGASLTWDLESALKAAGFQQIKILPKSASQSFIKTWAPGSNVSDYLVSATIEAVKP